MENSMIPTLGLYSLFFKKTPHHPDQHIPPQKKPQYSFHSICLPPLPMKNPSMSPAQIPPIKNVKPLTVVPELVRLACSFTHVLQFPNTQSLQQLIVEYLLTWVICEVVIPQRQNQGWSSSLQCLS